MAITAERTYDLHRRLQVLEGHVRRDTHKVRVKRHGKVVWEGRLMQLKLVKQVVEQVGKGSECGVMFNGFEEFEVGDEVEVVAQQTRRVASTATETGGLLINE